MKKFLIGIICLLICGCSIRDIQSYEFQDSPIIHISDRDIIEDNFLYFLNKGYSIVYTTRWQPNRKKHRIISFYVEKKDLLYSIDDVSVVLAQLWYIENKKVPSWLIKCEIFEIRQILKWSR